MAHYFLVIHELKESKGYARVTDIASSLGLTKGSVSTAINNLKKKNLIVEEENKFVTLTQKGHQEVSREQKINVGQKVKDLKEKNKGLEISEIKYNKANGKKIITYWIMVE